jgi:hypothetical protein
MPITYQQDSESVDFYAVFEGVITPEEITDYFLQLTSEMGSFGEARALLEIRKVTFMGFTFDSISKIAGVTKAHQHLLDSTKTAVVASQAVAYGIVRMYIAIRDPKYEFRVFRARDDAMLWLRPRCA